MFGEIPRNKLLRKISVHAYPPTNYLPGIDRNKLEIRSLPCMRKNIFYCAEKSIMQKFLQIFGM